MNVISQISDEIAVMYAGQIVEAGSTKAVLEKPGHPCKSATRLLTRIRQRFWSCLGLSEVVRRCLKSYLTDVLLHLDALWLLRPAKKASRYEVNSETIDKMHQNGACRWIKQS